MRVMYTNRMNDTLWFASGAGRIQNDQWMGEWNVTELPFLNIRIGCNPLIETILPTVLNNEHSSDGWHF